MRAHPSGDKLDVLEELLASGNWKLGSHALDVVGGDFVFSQVTKGLGDESAGSAGEGEHSAGVAAEVDLEVSKRHTGGGAIGVVNQAGRDLGAESELVGGCGGRRQNPQIPFSANRVDDGIHRRSDLTKDRMLVRDVVQTMADAADFPAAGEATERHGNGTGIAEVVKIVRRKRPPCALRLDAAEDLLGLVRCRGDVHVVNDAWFLQRSKPRFSAGENGFPRELDLIGEWVGDLVGGQEV